MTPEGIEKVSRNAWKGGERQQLRELSVLINTEIEEARQALTSLMPASLAATTAPGGLDSAVATVGPSHRFPNT